MQLSTPHPEVSLRKLSFQDVEALIALIDNPVIADNLRDSLPQPYRQADAESFIAATLAELPPKTFAITFRKAFAGVAGLKPQSDIHRHSAEIGYWIGEKYWNKGIATAAVACLSQYAFSSLNLQRVYAGLMVHNKASARVLEKCGYTLEGIHRQGITKKGNLVDELYYARLASDPPPSHS